MFEDRYVRLRDIRYNLIGRCSGVAAHARFRRRPFE
jgi:hypothetical protein